MCSTAKDATQHQSLLPESSGGFMSNIISNSSAILRALYIATCILCGFMVVWILIFPSSWLVGRSTLHDELLVKTMSEPNQVTSIELVTKYKGHSAIHFSHTLPGAIWAAAIPFQLHPKTRKIHPRAHRIVGRIFIATSILMMVGVGIILKRKLLYEESFKDLPPPPLSTTPGIVFQSFWFVATAVTALVQARSQKFASHQRYIIRHIASGIWVSLQRILLLTVFNRPPFTRMQQRQVFGDAAFLAIAVCFVCGEIVIYLLDARKMKKVH